MERRERRGSLDRSECGRRASGHGERQRLAGGERRRKRSDVLVEPGNQRAQLARAGRCARRTRRTRRARRTGRTHRQRAAIPLAKAGRAQGRGAAAARPGACTAAADAARGAGLERAAARLDRAEGPVRPRLLDARVGPDLVGAPAAAGLARGARRVGSRVLRQPATGESTYVRPGAPPQPPRPPAPPQPPRAPPPPEHRRRPRRRPRRRRRGTTGRAPRWTWRSRWRRRTSWR